MSRNTLYHFIVNHKVSDTGPSFFQADVGFELKHPWSGLSYAMKRLPLPMSDYKVFQGDQYYVLQTHYVRIFDGEAPDPIYTESQYQYTAIFTKSAGEPGYQLTLCFTDKDTLSGPPIFTLLGDLSADDSKSLLSLGDSFFEYAKQQAQHILAPLRDRLFSCVFQSEQSQRMLLQVIADLTASMLEPPMTYKTLLEEHQRVLAQLYPLVKHERYAYFYRLTGCILSILDRLKAELEAASEKDELEDGFVLVPSEADIVFVSPEVVTPSLEESMALFCLRCRAWDEKSSDAAVLLHQLLSDAMALFSAIEAKTSTVISDKAMCDFYQTFVRLNLNGEQLFSQSIVRGDYPSALYLFDHYSLQSSKYLSFALQQRNEALLSFVLRYGELSIDSQTVTIAGITYASAVEACILRHTEKDTMVPCFGVLIRHGASLFSKSSSGLPIADEILISPMHPMRVALEEHADLTLNQVVFYKQMIHSLHLIEESTEMDVWQRAWIKERIKWYGMILVGFISGELTSMALNRISALVETSAKHISDMILTQIQEEPEIKIIWARLEEHTKTYVSLLPRIEQLRYSKMTIDHLKRWQDVVCGDGFPFHERLNFELRKKVAIQYLNDNVMFIDYKTTLMELDKEFASKRNHLTKADKPKLTQRAMVVSIINEIIKKYAIILETESRPKDSFFQASPSRLLTDEASSSADKEAISP